MKNKTAAQFLLLLESLRWVIVQDSAVMLSEGREHYIFDNNPDIFKSHEFLDFQRKILIHIARHKRDVQLNATIDSVLPGIQNRLDNQSYAMVGQKEVLNTMNENIKGVVQNYHDFKEIYLSDKKEQVESVKRNIDIGMKNATDSIGSMITTEMTTICQHIGKYKCGENNYQITNNCDVQQQVDGANLLLDQNNKTNVSVISNFRSDNNEQMAVSKYAIPKSFPTFSSMINHWYSVVKNNENSKNKEWRKHLTASEKKRFQRLNRIIQAFKKVMADGVQLSDAEQRFESYYMTNNKSMAKLSDVYAKIS